MAEAVVFSLASKILSTIASPAFNKAYEKGRSIWEARDELAKLEVTMKTIHAVLLDAEKKQEGSAAVKEWIKRLKGVLYDAEDLFDEAATDDLLKQQMMEGKKKLSLRKKECPGFGLSTGVDWDSLPNLRELQLTPLPPLEELPQCLVQRQARGHLRITKFFG